MKTEQPQRAALRAARKELGMTNAELAGALKVSRPTLDAWLAPAKALRHRRMTQKHRDKLAALLKGRK